MFGLYPPSGFGDHFILKNTKLISSKFLVFDAYHPIQEGGDRYGPRMESPFVGVGGADDDDDNGDIS